MRIFGQPDDPMKDPDVLSFLQRTGVAEGLPPPGMLDHAVDATIEGIPRGLTEAGAMAMQVGGQAMGEFAAGAASRGINRNEEFRHSITDPTGDAADAMLAVAQTMRPDPITTGAAGQVGNELAAILPRTIVATVAAGPLAGMVAAGAPAGMSESTHLQQQGVDPATANQVGAVTGIATGIGAGLPAGGIVKGVLPDAALALAGNVGLGMAQRGATHEILDLGGYHDQAELYRAMDGTAIATDTIFSLLLSGAHHIPNAMVDAALTNKNADHFARGDGVLPANGASAQATEAAKAQALSQLLGGQPVNVGEHVADAELVRNPFHADPVLPDEVHAAARAADPTADRFELAADRIIGLERGKRPDAKNPTSTATGNGQFIESTWLNLIKRARPDLVEGKTRAQLLELRKDPDLSREMTIALARENAAALEAAGVPVTPDTLYAAHHFGPDKAIKFAQAAGDTPIEKILTPDQVKANKYLAGMTRDEVLANWTKRAGRDGGGARAADAAASMEPPELVAARTVLDDLEKDPAAVRFESGLRVAREGDGFRIEDLRDLGRAAEGSPPANVQPAVLTRDDAEMAIASAVRSAPAKGAKPTEAAAPLPEHPDVKAAVQLAAEAPEHPILTGYDADNRPVFHSLSEAVNDIHTEHAAAVKEAEAYTAGAECFLRQGVAA